MEFVDLMTAGRSKSIYRARVRLASGGAKQGRHLRVGRLLEDRRSESLDPTALALLTFRAGEERFLQWSKGKSGFELDQLRDIIRMLSLGVRAASDVDRIRGELHLADAHYTLGNGGEALSHVELALQLEDALETHDVKLRFQLERMRANILGMEDPAGALVAAESAIAAANEVGLDEPMVLRLKVHAILWAWRVRSESAPLDDAGLPVEQPNLDLIREIETIRSRYEALGMSESPDALSLEFNYCMMLMSARRTDELREHINWLAPLLRAHPSRPGRVELDRLETIATWFEPRDSTD